MGVGDPFQWTDPARVAMDHLGVDSLSADWLDRTAMEMASTK
jgi:hypothetical protein